jgi:tetratricopeptide (TPR) repeat protein
MSTNETLRKIYSKTMTSFFIFMVISFILCLIMSVLQNKFGNYEFHPQFYTDFIFNNSLYLFFKNLLIFSLIYFSFTYSLIINREDLITKSGDKPLFSKIVARGLYVLIFLTALFFIGQEFLIPGFETKLEVLRNNTTRAKSLLEKGNEFYDGKKWVESYRCYDEYVKIIDDDFIKERLREVKLKVSSAAIEKSKEQKKNIAKEDVTISENITDHMELADIYFQKQDYASALYYYQYVIDTNKTRRKEALEKKELVKKALKFRNSLLSDTEFNEFLTKQEKDIKIIYEKKNLAKSYTEKNEYQKAFFVYNDILKINETLRDSIQLQSEVFAKLTAESTELTEIQNKRFFIGKDNLVFMLSQNVMIKIGSIVKVLDLDKIENTFYLYDIRIYKYDSDFNLETIIYAPFGQAKSINSFTLYCYSFENRAEEYFPVPEFVEKSYFEHILSLIKIKDENETIANSYSYKDGFYELKKNVYTENIMKIGKIMKEAGFNVKSLIFNNYESDYIFKTPTDINILYNFSYDYNKALNFSLVKLSQLADLTFKKNNENSFSLGFNNTFLKTAIADKISRIFLFFALGLIIISISWKLRANYVGGIPALHFPFMLMIPVFIIFVVKICENMTTTLYSMLSATFEFNILLIICFVLNGLFLAGSIIYISANRN